MLLGLLFLFGLAFDFSGGLGDDCGSSLWSASAPGLPAHVSRL